MEFSTIIEPFRVHSVGPLVMTTPEQRRESLAGAGNLLTRVLCGARHRHDRVQPILDLFEICTP